MNGSSIMYYFQKENHKLFAERKQFTNQINLGFNPLVQCGFGQGFTLINFSFLIYKMEIKPSQLTQSILRIINIIIYTNILDIVGHHLLFASSSMYEWVFSLERCDSGSDWMQTSCLSHGIGQYCCFYRCLTDEKN